MENDRILKNYLNSCYEGIINGTAFIEPGWFELICNALDKIYSRCETSVEIVGIKEKFGELRINLGLIKQDDTNEVSRILKEVQKSASKTCQICGNAGELTRINGRMIILCDNHKNCNKREIIEKRKLALDKKAKQYHE